MPTKKRNAWTVWDSGFFYYIAREDDGGFPGGSLRAEHRFKAKKDTMESIEGAKRRAWNCCRKLNEAEGITGPDAPWGYKRKEV